MFTCLNRILIFNKHDSYYCVPLFSIYSNITSQKLLKLIKNSHTQNPVAYGLNPSATKGKLNKIDLVILLNMTKL